jgi:hypothetical protein
MATTVAGSGATTSRRPPARRSLGVLGALGLVLSGLGSFLLVSGVLLRFVVAGHVVRFPLNEYQIVTMAARNVTYFSSPQAKELTGIPMQVTVTTEGDSAASTDSRAVWNQFSSYIDLKNHVPYDAVTQRSAFDRRSGEAITCCGASVSSAAGTYTGPQSGQAFTWPIGAGKGPFQVFDTILHRPVTATFTGNATIAGIPVNRYTEQISAARVGTQKLPGQLVGLKGQATVTLDEYYQTTTQFWVDPVTGTVLDEDRNLKITLRDAGGVQRLVLLQGDFQTRGSSVAKVVTADRPHRSAIVAITTTVPLLLGISGAVILAAGILLSAGRRRRPSRSTPRYETVGMVP